MIPNRNTEQCTIQLSYFINLRIIYMDIYITFPVHNGNNNNNFCCSYNKYLQYIVLARYSCPIPRNQVNSYSFIIISFMCQVLFRNYLWFISKCLYFSIWCIMFFQWQYINEKSSTKILISLFLNISEWNGK